MYMAVNPTISPKYTLTEEKVSAITDCPDTSLVHTVLEKSKYVFRKIFWR